MRRKAWIALGALLAVAALVVVGLLSSSQARSALDRAWKAARLSDVAAGRDRGRPGRAVEIEAPPELEAPEDPGAGSGAPADDAPVQGLRRELPPGDVILHEHPTYDERFPGRRWRVGPGLTDAGTAFDNDAVSSVEVPTGLRLTLYEHEGGNGHRVLLGAGLHDLASYGFDDRASSVRVTRAGDPADTDAGPADAAELYEHRASTGTGPGRTWRLALSAARSERLFTARAQDFADDTVSAVWVPDGYELTLFDQPDGRGPAVVLGPGFHEMDYLDFNDRTSSVRLRRLR